MAHGVATLFPAKIKQTLRPSVFDSLGELRLPLEATVGWLSALTYPWRHAEPGYEKVIMFIPGFLAGDVSLAPMAHFCRWLGHRTQFSGIWSNSRCPRETMEHLGTRLEHIHDRFESPVVIIGQSLGGVYAREIARRRPDLVERVISLGSPIRTVRGASNLAVQVFAESIAMLRGKGKGCLSEECQCGVLLSEQALDEVPTTLVYSRTDGVVHWECCIDNSDSDLVENIEVMSSHIGMAINADVYRVIAERLALPLRPRLRVAAMQQQAALRDPSR